MRIGDSTQKSLRQPHHVQLKFGPPFSGWFIFATDRLSPLSPSGYPVHHSCADTSTLISLATPYAQPVPSILSSPLRAKLMHEQRHHSLMSKHYYTLFA
ncbi:hypothetical protein XA68_16248 [Ophiocordyceps unilateralis]|uniref:Uncharacterized protein n=1 Tax=Ophiocordyceps unilateralis TaxID=268505 RepID=A0A2A9P6Y2_OPHUN|nr:hypothetical protein XA68_16248 [Ophiocordyceps unilateralis]